MPDEYYESITTHDDFEQLLASHQLTLQSFILGLMPSYSDVQDVIQEVNITIWEKRVDFKVGSNFKAWMLTIAKYKVLAVWRDEKRRKVWSVSEETLTKMIDSAAAVCFDDGDQLHENLRRCIDQLNKADRRLILRRYFDGSSLKDIANELGRKAENLKGSMHRIRLSLRACVQKKRSIERALS